jgi:hypothetical protein
MSDTFPAPLPVPGPALSLASISGTGRLARTDDLMWKLGVGLPVALGSTRGTTSIVHFFDARSRVADEAPGTDPAAILAPWAETQTRTAR